MAAEERSSEEMAAARSAVMQVLIDREERRSRERRLSRRLRRRNLRLEDGPTGYAIADRYSTLCEAMDLTLDQAEAWAVEHILNRRAATPRKAA